MVDLDVVSEADEEKIWVFITIIENQSFRKIKYRLLDEMN